MLRKLIVFGFVVATCGCNDCDYREVADYSYRGDPLAESPYAEATELDHITASCTSMGCTYYLTATVWVHNPLQYEYTSDVSCEFADGEYTFGETVARNITVAANTSKKMELNQQHITPDVARISVTCSF